MSDIDLLVRKEKLIEVETQLLDMGYMLRRERRNERVLSRASLSLGICEAIRS